MLLLRRLRLNVDARNKNPLFAFLSPSDSTTALAVVHAGLEVLSCAMFAKRTRLVDFALVGWHLS